MKTQINTACGLAAFSLAALPLAVQAQSDSTPNARSVDLNPVVVTATRAPRTADETLSSVTVLDEATLRRQDPVELTDLFRGQPGVDVSGNGSYGKTKSVYIRGVDNGGSLLLIDGIRLRSATLGEASWQHLDPRMFERAEIVRGPRGSLYGADAMGGVVQLFTHDAEEGSPTPTLSIAGGSFDTKRMSATLSGSEGGTRYSVAGSRIDTDGTAVREGGEDKGYDNTSGMARVAHTFDNGAEMGVLALRSLGNTEIDSGEIDFVQQVAGVYGEIPVTENWRSRLMLSEARDESDNLDQDGNLTSIIDTQARTVRWRNTFNLGFHELIAGVEHENDEVSGTESYDESRRDNIGYFAQGLFDFAPFSIQASLRHDDNKAFGGETTGSLATGYDLDEHHTLRASLGTAFKAPSFNDLYWPYQESAFNGTTYITEGNKEIDPETSNSYELGVRGQYQSLYWDLAIYQTDIDNLIDWAKDEPSPNVERWRPTNVENVRIRGAELAAGTELDAWTLQAALTYTDPEDRDTGNQLERRASQSARFDLDRELGDWSLGGSWVVQNHRYDDPKNDERLPGFGLLDLRADWDFAPMLSTRLTVDNALDKEYETAGGYINAGRAVMLSVNFGAQ